MFDMTDLMMHTDLLARTAVAHLYDGPHFAQLHETEKKNWLHAALVSLVSLDSLRKRRIYPEYGKIGRTIRFTVEPIQRDEEFARVCANISPRMYEHARIVAHCLAAQLEGEDIWHALDTDERERYIRGALAGLASIDNDLERNGRSCVYAPIRYSDIASFSLENKAKLPEGSEAAGGAEGKPEFGRTFSRAGMTIDLSVQGRYTWLLSMLRVSKEEIASKKRSAFLLEKLRILAYVLRCWVVRGIPLSYPIIASLLGKSHSSAIEHCRYVAGSALLRGKIAGLIEEIRKFEGCVFDPSMAVPHQTTPNKQTLTFGD